MQSITSKTEKGKTGTGDKVPECTENQPGMTFEIPLDCQTGDCEHNLEHKKQKHNPF